MGHRGTVGTEKKRKGWKWNEPEESYRGGWRVCGIDDCTADCGSGAGGCGVDGYFGWAAGGQSTGHGGVWAHHTDRLVRFGYLDCQRGLQRDREQRCCSDHRGISTEAWDVSRRLAEGQLRRGEG